MKQSHWSAERIKALRQRRMETQKEFAAHFPVERNTVYNWECGASVPMWGATIRKLEELESKTPSRAS